MDSDPRRAFLPRIRARLDDLSLATRASLLYVVLIVVSVIASSLVYQRLYSSFTERRISDVSAQMVYAINASLEGFFENIEGYYLTIVSNDDVRAALLGDRINLDTGVDTGNRVIKFLSSYFWPIPGVSSIYLFDNHSGTMFYMDRQTVRIPSLSSIQQASWYQQAMSDVGRFIIARGTGGLFDIPEHNGIVSFIRGVNDFQTLKPIGIFMINVRSDFFQTLFAGTNARYRMDMAILDQEGATVVDFREVAGAKTRESLRTARIPDGSAAIVAAESHRYIVSSLAKNRYGWRIVGAIPFDALFTDTRILSLVTIIIILVNGIAVLLGILLISRMITIPIRTLLASMKGVESGKLRPVDIRAGRNEIGRLRDGYNYMISEIEQLLQRTISAQKSARQAELNVLQEQIKPHFLYNTFDAISSLILAGDNKKAYATMQALGSYYRASLSHGNEVVTVEEELGIVKNYLTILKVRYGAMFDFDIEAEPGIERFIILKLILQPLAENAVYHGIKPKAEAGHLHISVRPWKEGLRLSVSDDGVGMEEQVIEAILGRTESPGRKSIGLRGTIERLQIFYGSLAPRSFLEIHSRRGEGTTVTITIPHEPRDTEGQGK